MKIKREMKPLLLTRVMLKLNLGNMKCEKEKITTVFKDLSFTQ